MMKKIIMLVAVVGVLSLSIAVQPTYAAGTASTGAQDFLKAIGITDGTIIPAGCLANTTITTCGTNEALQTLVNLVQVLVALTGTGALLMFTYGGLLWIISAGNSERVEKGKSAMVNAAIGIAIVFGGWLIVNTIVLVLTKGEVGGQGTIFGQKFNESPNVQKQQFDQQLDNLGPAPKQLD